MQSESSHRSIHVPLPHIVCAEHAFMDLTSGSRVFSLQGDK
jgi:hypothetical protein